MRLDRFVSQAAGISRRDARAAIRRGRITLQGSAVRQADAQVPEGAEVALLGRRLQLPQAVYLMLHKPCGLISATRDDHQATVLSLLPPALAGRAHVVGRLDKDTSGLLLLSDDGSWSHRITSPRHHCEKSYLADLAEPLVPDAERRLAEGMLLRGETDLTRPARLQRITPWRARVVVTEGRYHLVRRLFAVLGNRVVALHRERIGGLALDPALAAGQWRALTPEECRLAVDFVADGLDSLPGSQSAAATPRAPR